MEELELIVHELIHENNIDDVMQEKNGWQIKPVCLVDPKLIDWIEKIREGFKEGWVKEAEKSKLFDELNALLPERE